MKSFEYAAPKSLSEATALLSDAWGRTEILAGGTDLVTCLKQHLLEPSRVVSLRNLAELRGITQAADTVRIGALTPLGELAANPQIRQNFPALVTAAEGIGSPQLLTLGTVGGDLCQRPRCWYYRNGYGLLGEFEGTSLVREGDNRFHALFGNDGPALFVSSSSLGPPLIALQAELVAVGPNGSSRRIPAAGFFRTPKNVTERETELRPNEILTEVFVPLRGLKNATYEVRHRHGLDWPYVTASVGCRVAAGSIAEAIVVLGHVAPTPWVAAAAGATLRNVRADEATAARCGDAATQGARPLSRNAYKLPMVKAAVKRAILAAAA